MTVYLALGRLRRVGERNLSWRFRNFRRSKRGASCAACIRNLGWQLVEFCRMTRYTPENTRGWIRTEGMEHYLAAEARGKGVLVLTGHLGAWELSSFYHSLMGHPMGMVIRRLDNRVLDDFVNGIRCLHGNRVLHKDDFARGLLHGHARRRDGRHPDGHQHDPAAGCVCEILSGHQPARRRAWRAWLCKTGAAVLPGFMPVGRKRSSNTCCTSGRSSNLHRTEDQEADILAATQQCNDVLESWIRRYPDQWLWIHRRWKTRPPGEASLY